MPGYGSGGTVGVRLTGYWPFQAGLSSVERRMEGGVNDRRGRPLHTLEAHLADPSRHPYVSVSGDDALWPYGQRISLSPWPDAVFRVVDTGSHFRGAGKVYRVPGREPLDVCVETSHSMVTALATATIWPGDNFASGAQVDVAALGGGGVHPFDVAPAGEVGAPDEEFGDEEVLLVGFAVALVALTLWR